MKPQPLKGPDHAAAVVAHNDQITAEILDDLLEAYQEHFHEVEKCRMTALRLSESLAEQLVAQKATGTGAMLRLMISLGNDVLQTHLLEWMREGKVQADLQKAYVATLRELLKGHGPGAENVPE
jgi:hypothetical protein